ncbi:hypothetical protein CICLE_v10003468mg [Citrus x clementina]|uniref:DUF679 domain membrane protein 7 n=2 Tax=Citrus TaxID=2706 RepID=A0ACB8KJY6_CITSI|nr:protein DMP10 [Citrus x clementina]ESR46437.1 hypothetical protein CICLE_v10003468mg [Citrus x clementina]KAH9754712.1 DUF679 domain membrane protein 7 [Citrus sinensis]
MVQSADKPKAVAKLNCPSAANLANLLPTGTVLAYQALMPSLSNNGTCLAAHKYLSIVALAGCSIVCFLSSFTDSYYSSKGKLYYGIATTTGLHIFNKKDSEDEGEKADNNIEDGDKGTEKEGVCLDTYKIRWIDFVHAFTSLLVFLVFATTNSDARRCFFPHPGPNTNVLLMHLPILVGAFASLLFMLFPTDRRGFGFADHMAPNSSRSPSQESPTLDRHLRAKYLS